MVGGDDYNSSPFNLATQGQRQPGSAFKPFVLAEALKQGHLPHLRVVVAQEGVRRPGLVREVHGRELQRRLRRRDHARQRDDVTSDNSVYAEVGIKIGHQEDRQARAPDGHPHAGLAQLGDDARRPQAGRDAARHGARVPDVRAQGQARLRHAQPRARSARAQPVPGPVGIRAIRRKEDGKLKADRAAQRRAGAQRGQDPAACSTRASPTRSTRSSRASSRTAPASARCSIRSIPVAGKTGTTENYGDAWFVGWTPRVHGRGVGRLPQRSSSR